MNYQTSSEIDKVGEALALAQAEIRGSEKDAKNPHFGQMYSTLDSVWDACRTALTKHGLSVLQPVSSDDGATVCISTVLLHKTGQWIASDLRMKPVKGDPQGLGSAITYGRRYGLAAMVGVSPYDDDGDEASGRNGRKPEPEPKREKPAEVIEPELKTLWAQITNKQTAIAAIQGWRELLGDDAYNGILATCGIQMAEQVKTITDARTVVGKMYRTHKGLAEVAV